VLGRLPIGFHKRDETCSPPRSATDGEGANARGHRASTCSRRSMPVERLSGPITDLYQAHIWVRRPIWR
jgi:hypothetical protein